MEEKIINEVRRRQCLYDPRSPQYGDSDVVCRAWEEIAVGFKIRSETARSIWESLRRDYKKVIKLRREKKSEHCIRQILSCKLEEAMSFLLDSESTTTDSSTFTSSSNHNSAASPQFEQQDRMQVCTPIEDVEHAIIQIINFKKPQEEAKVNGGCGGGGGNDNLDDTDLFFLSLARTLKTFPVGEQAKMKLLVSQAILQMQIDLGNSGGQSTIIRKNSSQCNGSSSLDDDSDVLNKGFLM